MTPDTVPGRDHNGDCRHMTSEHALGSVTSDTGSCRVSHLRFLTGPQVQGLGAVVTMENVHM